MPPMALDGDIMKDKILVVCVSYSGFIHNTVFESILTNMTNFAKKHPDVQVGRMWNCGHFVDRARQDAHEQALNGGFTHIWWHDDDIVAPDDALIKLYEADEDVVGSVAFQRAEPYAICAYRMDPEHGIDDWDHFLSVRDVELNTGLKEVDAVGTGCMLMKTDVSEPLEKPWWQWPKTGAEDINFCVRLRKVGKPIFVHTDIQTFHLSFMPQPIGADTHKAFLDRMRQVVKEAPEVRKHPEFFKLGYLLDGDSAGKTLSVVK